MPDFYFDALNHHVIHIERTEAEVKELFENYLKTTKTADFTMFCVFLAQKGVVFYYYSQKNPETFIKIESGVN